MIYEHIYILVYTKPIVRRTQSLSYRENRTAEKFVRTFRKIVWTRESVISALCRTNFWTPNADRRARQRKTIIIYTLPITHVCIHTIYSNTFFFIIYFIFTAVVLLYTGNGRVIGPPLRMRRPEDQSSSAASAGLMMEVVRHSMYIDIRVGPLRLLSVPRHSDPFLA